MKTLRLTRLAAQTASPSTCRGNIASISLSFKASPSSSSFSSSILPPVVADRSFQNFQRLFSQGSTQTTTSKSKIKTKTNTTGTTKDKDNDPWAARRNGDTYTITKEEVERYHRDGYLVLGGIVSETELKEIDETFMMFMDRKIPVPGKDFCDMSKPLNAKFEEYSIINAMLPRVYFPPLQGNIYERRTASITRQLFKDVEMVLDYDQLLAKKPSKSDAIFAWHQDMAYWPPTRDTRTATFSLAVDASTPQNGCLKVVPGSHKEKELRHHYPLGKSATREDAHTLVTDVDEKKEKIEVLAVPKGGITVHNERIAHASGGNLTTGWRRTYVVAYRTKETVEWERAHGFTHSHNDTFNWDQFNKWQEK